MQPIPVAILGATGNVGQQFIQMLVDNPWFRITALAASERNVGKRYAEACSWRLSSDMPESVRDMVIQPCAPGLDARLAFSALPAGPANEIEIQLAASGLGVFSNASAHRMDPDVPLLIPEINGAHLGMIAQQRESRGWREGFIVTNPNCSTIGLVVPLKPLQDAYGIKRVIVTTMQAVSGAGYPGVPSLDMLDNVVPYIRSEEEKMASEPQKILGALDSETGTVRSASFKVSASCNRVAVRDGHMESISLELERSATAEEIISALTHFESRPYALGCPSAIEHTILYRSEVDRPQPYLDRTAGNGLAVTVGRLRPCEVLDYKMTVLSHNTVRGAAGCSVLNAELMAAEGML